MISELIGKNLPESEYDKLPFYIKRQCKRENAEKILNLQFFIDHPEAFSKGVLMHNPEKVRSVTSLSFLNSNSHLFSRRLISNGNINSIKSIYTIYYRYHLTDYITASSLLLDREVVLAKINYLNMNHIPLTKETEKGKIIMHPLISMNGEQLEELYGIDEKAFVKKFSKLKKVNKNT